MIDQKEMVK